MKYTLYINIIFLLACKESTQNVHNKSENENANIVKYLKENFRIEIDTSKMGFYYKQDLREKKRSLEVDSLISSRISTEEYKPLNLRFIKYDNYFGIQDTSYESHFSVNLIEDRKNNVFYVDYINPMAGMIIEDYCMWSYRQDKISEGEIGSSISKEDIKAYNSISSNRVYGENETHAANKKIGIQSFLNSVFRFSRPTRIQLDSLFYNYDKYFYYERDTLLNPPKDLYSFLRVQTEKIRAEPNYGSLEKRLGLLKGQINLLFLQIEQTSSDNLIFWIYKNDSRLRVRKLLISGNRKSTYSYNIDEYQTCF